MQQDSEKPIFSWMILIFLCLSLGLAPYSPEPHIVEKLKLLMVGNLTKPVDMFDFVLHGAPWVLLIVKVVKTVRLKQ